MDGVSSADGWTGSAEPFPELAAGPRGGRWRSMSGAANLGEPR
jgi:hypothetical protein